MDIYEVDASEDSWGCPVIYESLMLEKMKKRLRHMTRERKQKKGGRTVFICRTQCACGKKSYHHKVTSSELMKTTKK